MDDNSDGNSGGTLGDMNTMGLFKAALRRIPVLWYVVGVGLTGSVGVFLVKESGDLRSAAVGAAVVLMLAVLVIILNAIATNQTLLRMPALMITWVVAVGVVLVSTSLFFNQPAHLRHYLEGKVRAPLSSSGNPIMRYGRRIRECRNSLSDLGSSLQLENKPTAEQLRGFVSTHTSICASVLDELADLD